MKHLTKTKFFLSLEESQNIQSFSLNDAYDEFVSLLFAGNTDMGKEAYHNLLVYTSVELTSLPEISEKKCGNLSSQSH